MLGGVSELDLIASFAITRSMRPIAIPVKPFDIYERVVLARQK